MKTAARRKRPSVRITNATTRKVVAAPDDGVPAEGSGAAVAVDVSVGSGTGAVSPRSTLVRASNGDPSAVPVTTRFFLPVTPEGRVTSRTVCDSRARAAAVKAVATALRLAALATDPPPTSANCSSTSALASGLLNATISARTFAFDSAWSAALRWDFSRAGPPWISATVSPPSLRRMMLRSPFAPRASTASWTPEYRAVSPFERSPDTARLTLSRSVVGSTSTPDVLANETTPTLTSSGTAARKSLTAVRTVAMPDAPIEPLVSMTSMVERGC